MTEKIGIYTSCGNVFADLEFLCQYWGNVNKTKDDHIEGIE